MRQPKPQTPRTDEGIPNPDEICAVLWQPFPGPQTAGVLTEAQELFYGGAAGGGKSDLLLGLAGTQHRRSIIFRREFPRMRELIERSREIYNRRNDERSKDSFNEGYHIWRLMDDRVIEFASIKLERNKENYRGRPHDFYGWDEITEFPESVFRFVNAWNRTTIPGQRCRVVATGNPPTDVPGQWVIRYWAPWLDKKHPNPALPGELRFFAMIDGAEQELLSGERFMHGNELIRPRSRTFIPASLDDNPALRDTEYRAILMNLPEPMRSQMAYGDFTIGVDDDPWQLIPTHWVDLAIERWKHGRPHDDQGKPIPLSALGTDVAEGGADNTVVAELYGWWLAPISGVSGKETNTPAKVGYEVQKRWDRKAPIAIDAIGQGAGPFHYLRESGMPDIIPFIGSAESLARDITDTFGFVNLRAEAFWRLREALDPEGDIRMALPDNPVVKQEMTAIRWKPTVRGIQIEPKESIISRIGHSTDYADAISMAVYAALHVGKKFGFEAW